VGIDLHLGTKLSKTRIMRLSSSKAGVDAFDYYCVFKQAEDLVKINRRSALSGTLLISRHQFMAPQKSWFYSDGPPYASTCRTVTCLWPLRQEPAQIGQWITQCGHFPVEDRHH